MKLRLLAGGLAATTAVLAPSAASAAPKPDPAFEVTLTCEGQDPIDLVVPGGGEFTPGFGDGRVFIPVEFGAFTGTFTDLEGNVFPANNEPVVQNARKGGKHPLIECDVAISGQFPEGNFEQVGTVIGFVVGKP